MLDHEVAAALEDDLAIFVFLHDITGAVDRLARLQWIILVFFCCRSFIFQIAKAHARTSQTKLSFFADLCFGPIIFDNISGNEFCRKPQRDPLIICKFALHRIQERIEKLRCAVSLTVARIRDHFFHLIDQFCGGDIPGECHCSKTLIQFLLVSFPCCKTGNDRHTAGDPVDDRDLIFHQVFHQFSRLAEQFFWHKITGCFGRDREEQIQHAHHIIHRGLVSHMIGKDDPHVIAVGNGAVQDPVMSLHDALRISGGTGSEYDAGQFLRDFLFHDHRKLECRFFLFHDIFVNQNGSVELNRSRLFFCFAVGHQDHRLQRFEDLFNPLIRHGLIDTGIIIPCIQYAVHAGSQIIPCLDQCCDRLRIFFPYKCWILSTRLDDRFRDLDRSIPHLLVSHCPVHIDKADLFRHIQYRLIQQFRQSLEFHLQFPPELFYIL